MNSRNLNISIVLYNTPIEELEGLLSGFESVNFIHHIYLIDNSPTDKLKNSFSKWNRVVYEHVGKNLGYGKGHNVAIKYSINDDEIEYHLVVNPDIIVSKAEFQVIYDYMGKHNEVGQLMPKIIYENGENQYLCKEFPTPWVQIVRRFFPDSTLKKSVNKKYELHNFSHQEILDGKCLSGCFMLMRTDVLKKVGLFDERFFMYFEDVDLCRRISLDSIVRYFPLASVVHKYNKESYRSKKLLFYHISSSFKYFFKWGI